MRKQSLEYILTQYDMIDAFNIHLLQPGSHPPQLLEDINGDPIKVNLLSHHSSLTEDQVRQYILFLKRYGKTYDVQNLDWSQELFNNSCNTDLRDKINEKILGVHSFEVGGPLLFYHAMTLITSQTADAVRALTLRVTNLKLTDIKGENVGTAISQMRGALVRLKALDKVPNDIVEKILDTMQTSSVDKFNRFFEAISFQLRLQPEKYKAEDILHLAETTHREFVASGEWAGRHNSGSTFTASTMQTTNNENKRRWRRKGPDEGESERMVKNGSTYFWCGKCRLWNATHRTSEHIKGGPPTSGDAKVNSANSLDSETLPQEAHKSTTFYSPFSLQSLSPSENTTSYAEGTSMALLTQQNQELTRFKKDIARLERQLETYSKQNNSENYKDE